MKRTPEVVTRLLLFLAVMLLAGHLLVWTNLTHTPQAMAAGLPDSGAQLQAIIDELKDTNKRLDSMQKFIESGNLKVQVKADKEPK